jgi:hypothetical protein
MVLVQTITRRLAGHNDPLADTEIQSTLRAKLGDSILFAKTLCISAYFVH